MLMPSIFGENLFDDWMDFPFHDMDRELRNMDRRLYGRNMKHEMKTDVKENETGYEIDMDLPGFKKDEIRLELEDGYLTVSADKALQQENNDDKGKLIRQERYTGSMQRSFYVGKKVKEEDIKAKFEHGVLSLQVPKEEAVPEPEKKTIMIEG